MKTLEQRALTRAKKIIADSNIDTQDLKDDVRVAVESAFETYDFDSALTFLREQTDPRSSNKGSARLLFGRVLNALDGKWLLAQAVASDD